MRVFVVFPLRGPHPIPLPAYRERGREVANGTISALEQAGAKFDHRVLFQMSAADSSFLIDSPAANKLGFYRAIYFSEEQGLIEKFRPYGVPGERFLRERLT